MANANDKIELAKQTISNLLKRENPRMEISVKIIVSLIQDFIDASEKCIKLEAELEAYQWDKV